MSSHDTHLSARIPEDMADKIDIIANATDRTKSWVVMRALSMYMAGEGEDILQYAIGRAALDHGEKVDFDEALDEIDLMIDQIEAQRAAG